MTNHMFDREKYEARKAAKTKAKEDTGKANGWKPLQEAVQVLIQALGI